MSTKFNTSPRRTHFFRAASILVLLFSSHLFFFTNAIHTRAHDLRLNFCRPLLVFVRNPFCFGFNIVCSIVTVQGLYIVFFFPNTKPGEKKPVVNGLATVSGSSSSSTGGGGGGGGGGGCRETVFCIASFYKLTEKPGSKPYSHKKQNINPRQPHSYQEKHQNPHDN
jgi:uncharacterized membrane protein YgcG